MYKITLSILTALTITLAMASAAFAQNQHSLPNTISEIKQLQVGDLTTDRHYIANGERIFQCDTDVASKVESCYLVNGHTLNDVGQWMAWKSDRMAKAEAEIEQLKAEVEQLKARPAIVGVPAPDPGPTFTPAR